MPRSHSGEILEEDAQAAAKGSGFRRARWLSPPEWLAVAFAFLVVHAALFRKLIYAADCCDANGYRALARLIVDHGLFSAAAFSGVRTYGYPLFLSVLARAERITSVPMELLAAECQLCLYLFAAWLLRNEIRQISRRLSQWVFVALCLNVFVLVYAAETLTESLSLSIMVLMGWCWLRSVRLFRSRRWMMAAAAGGALAGFAVMVRPANLFLPAAWIVGQTVLAVTRRIGPRPGEAMRRLAVLALALAATAAPCVPQLYTNIVYGKKATPLVVADIGNLDINLGITSLCYVTGVPPVPANEVDYYNPFSKGTTIDSAHPATWYRQHALAGAMTLFMHAFALVHQDLIFPYVVDLSPWYRIPLGVASDLAVGLALYALWLWARAARRREPGRRAVLRISALIATAYILGAFVMHGTVRVEPRYGLPLILLAAPLAAAAFRHWRTLPLRRLILPAAAIVIYAVMAVALEGWMRSQSPIISDWGHLGANLALFQPARQSSTFGLYGAARGVDGIRSRPGVFGGFHTGNDLNPWWEVDLGALCRLTQVRLYNGPPYERAATLRVLLSKDDSNWTEVYSNGGRRFDAAPLSIPLEGTSARYVRVQLNERNWLHLDEVEVYGFKR